MKKILSKKSSYIFLYFGEWNFLTLILRYFLYFLYRKLFLYFRKWKPRKNSLYFRKRNFLTFQEVSFLARKMKKKKKTQKKYLLFKEMERSSPKPKKHKFLILSKKQKSLVKTLPPSLKKKTVLKIFLYFLKESLWALL